MENEFDDSIDVQGGIIEVTDDEFDTAFSTKSPSADSLKGGKKPAEADDKDEEEEETEKQPDPKKKTAAPAKKVDKPNPPENPDEIEEVTDEEFENEKPKAKKAAAKEEEEVEETDLPAEEKALVTKAHVEYLIENNLWADFEGREDIEWTDENFAIIAEQQDENRIQARVQEELQKTGYYGEAILQYARNGGNPEKLIDIFKTQQAFKEFDLTTPEGQRDQVLMYYTQVMNWDKKRAEKHISRLEADEELEVEAKHIDSHYSKQIKETVEQEQKRQAQQRKAEEEAVAKFTNSVSEVMNSRKDLDDAEKKRLLNQYTQYKEVEGAKVNQMYVNFQKVQQDPELFVLMLQFLDNPKKFIQVQKKDGEKEANVKRLKFFNANGTADTKTKSQAKVTRKSSGGGLDGWG